MNKEIFVSQRGADLRCQWMTTGNRNHPLACVWVEIARTQESTPDSNRTGDGGIRLCA